MPGVERALAAWQSRPLRSRPLLLSDFDGTLADFAVDPEMVRLPDNRRALLHSLSARSDLSLALVSGRRSADLRQRSGVGPSVFCAGLHGLEIDGPGLKFTHASASIAAPAIGVLAGELRRAMRELPGVVVEDKGLSVTLHTRGASKADNLHAKTRFKAIAGPYISDGLLRVQPGDEMAELLPNIDWNKGDAVRCIMKHVEAQHKEPVWPVYIGDDATDEDAFEAVGDSGLTIAVSQRPAGAAFRLPDPNAVEAFLAAVLATE